MTIDEELTLSEMLTAEHHKCFAHTLQLILKIGAKARRSTVLIEILEIISRHISYSRSTTEANNF